MSLYIGWTMICKVKQSVNTPTQSQIAAAYRHLERTIAASLHKEAKRKRGKYRRSAISQND